MDPVSQGALGAALAASTRSGEGGRRRVVPALALGAAAGMAPDLDVLIRSSTDPLLFLEYHRQFTHALAFIPFGALACAAILHGLVSRRLRFGETYLFCLLGYGTHGLLDACTSYGTQLLWPFSEVRVAWNVISVIDPLFTLPVLALLAWALVRRSPAPARLGMAWMVVYIAFGVFQGWRAEQAGLALAHARGQAPERLLVKPSFGNVLVWKIVYAAESTFHVDAVRLGARTTYFPGTSIPALDEGEMLPWLSPGTRQAADLERFREFSEGYLAPAPERANAVIDVRYSFIPNEIDPLWGVVLDPHQQSDHVEFFTDRAASSGDRRAYLRMLMAPGVSLDDALSSASAHTGTGSRQDGRAGQTSAQLQSACSQPSPSRQPSLQ